MVSIISTSHPKRQDINNGPHHAQNYAEKRQRVAGRARSKQETASNAARNAALSNVTPPLSKRPRRTRAR
eukprot:11158885-Lingulodinium_polyedra.AAC.1